MCTTSTGSFNSNMTMVAGPNSMRLPSAMTSEQAVPNDCYWRTETLTKKPDGGGCFTSHSSRSKNLR